MSVLRTLSDIELANKVVLCRVDLNVPMQHGKVEDATRITRLVPTIKELVEKNAKVVLISHFGRPKGEFVREMSLAPLADAVSEALGGKEVKFALDCVGDKTQEAIREMSAGDILLLENVRFHKGETKNDPEFARALAGLGEIFVNDTFSCSHRTHASISGIAEILPAVSGRLLEEEVNSLQSVLGENLNGKVAAIVGGSKISTKIDALNSLVQKTDKIIIGGAMANTFLKAKGYNIGKSLCEDNLVDTAKEVLSNAEQENCKILLPVDVVVAKEFAEYSSCRVVSIDDVESDEMILDIGPATISELQQRLQKCQTLIWNGPMGAFEIRPFDVGTISLARVVANLTKNNSLISVAGGGDVVAALKVGGLTEEFTYISTAGGAFLEWLEGKVLPGVSLLYK